MNSKFGCQGTCGFGSSPHHVIIPPDGGVAFGACSNNKCCSFGAKSYIKKDDLLTYCRINRIRCSDEDTVEELRRKIGKTPTQIRDSISLGRPISEKKADYSSRASMIRLGVPLKEPGSMTPKQIQSIIKQLEYDYRTKDPEREFAPGRNQPRRKPGVIAGSKIVRRRADKKEIDDLIGAMESMKSYREVTMPDLSKLTMFGQRSK
jgi:hypothetical protein